MKNQTRKTLPSVEQPDRPPKRRIKVVYEIIETLRADIVTRRLPHGARLPSEKEMAERFKVSQPTVREAIRSLETIGLVEVFHGSGAFVRSQGNYALASALQTLLQLEGVEILDVLNVRQMVGRHSIEAAANNATVDDLSAIEAASSRCDGVYQVKDVEQVIASVVDFQQALSAASHNPILHSLETFLVALLHEVQVKSLIGRGLRFWRARASKFQPHRVAILVALRSGDPKLAREAMDRYFEAQRTRFEQDGSLRSLNLASPKLVTIVSDMVRQSRQL